MAHTRVKAGEIAAGGGIVARFAAGPDDLARVLALRAARFRAGADDRDRFDATARHVMVETGDGRLAASFRLMAYPDGTAPGASYAATFYDLSPLAAHSGPLMEMGRFCGAPELVVPDVLRLAWAALTRVVDDESVRFIFGCTSFEGTDPAAFRAGFALLAARHLAPRGMSPGRKAAEVHRLAPGDAPREAPRESRGASAQLPPLLRSYLAMGGWVSDHAVIDRDLGTIHVFTGLDIGGVSAARARALRAL